VSDDTGTARSGPEEPSVASQGPREVNRSKADVREEIRVWLREQERQQLHDLCEAQSVEADSMPCGGYELLEGHDPQSGEAEDRSYWEVYKILPVCHEGDRTGDAKGIAGEQTLALHLLNEKWKLKEIADYLLVHPNVGNHLKTIERVWRRRLWPRGEAS
jgi:hypothetical protein